MVSLLLVLSVFVSSGVLWELRDTVVTMVNEPLCGFEEHEHTDECYEYRLVCGLEENEEHTHTDECYEKVLVCGYEEHLHTALCYTDEEFHDGCVQSDDEESNIVSIDLPADTEEEMLLAQLDPAAAMEMQLGSAMRAAYAADPTELESPPGVPTIDNIARGINITLFDYYDDDNTLEARQNNYDVSWNEDTHRWVHKYIKYVGVNYDYEKNSNRNIYDDILFFAYGTPDFTGTLKNSDDNDHYGDYYYNVYTRTPVGQISKNNYSGDYNTNSTYTSQLSGNRPIQGIVLNELVDGYPKINNVVDGVNYGSSLAYLFNDADSEYKTVYKDVNYFLQEKNGHLVYDSNKNYAYYNQDTHNFTVYNGTYHIINKDHHRDQDYNNLTDETYEGANGGEFKIGFFPFDQYNLNRRDPNFNGNGFNHHFGMKMEAEFKNLNSPTEPIVFKYSGDDDMWVYVDDVLVLDIGGIHEPAAGMIDFTNGLVWTQDNDLGDFAKDAYETLQGETDNNLPALVLVDSENNKYNIPFPDNGVNTDGASESKWKVETISSKFDSIAGKNCDASDNKSHNIKMFYLERGGCYSNLAIDMNLPTVRPLTVTKNIDYGGHYSNDYDRTDDINCPKYQFEVYVEDSNNPGSYILADLGAGIANPFYLKDGERKDFYDLDETKKYYVVEKGIDTNIYSEVLVNGVSRIISDGDVFSGEPIVLSQTDTYNFTNVIREENEMLKVTKKWFDSSGSEITGPSERTVKFKVFRSDNGGPEQPVEIGGKITFTLKSPSWSWESPVMLPKVYGNHFYTYTVEEQNIPEGYKASYGTDDKGNPIIMNRDIRNFDIHVKKNWINTLSEDRENVHLVLKRERAEYEGSKPTSLQINLHDTAGNILSTYKIDTADAKVYVGGSIEFSFEAPNNVDYYIIEPATCTPSTTEIQQIGERSFEISNLAEETDSNSYANVVNLKVYNDEAEDSLLLLHHSFSKSMDGWEPNAGAEVLNGGLYTYAKGDALLIRGRTKANQGARLDLDPMKFKANKTYTFSTYIRVDSFANNEGVLDNNGKKYVMFKFTLNDGREKPNNESYHQMLTVAVYAGQWTQLTGTVTLPEDINPYGMYLIVESFDPENSDFVGPASFRMDEFVAVEGNNSISVEETTGNVSVTPLERVIYDDPFGNNDYNGWSSNGGTSLSTLQYNNDYYIRIRNRNNVSNGIKKNVPLLVPGKEYRFMAELSGDDGTSTHNYILSIDKINLDANEAEWSNYKNIGETGNISEYDWGTIDTLYTIPAEAKRDEMYLYFETAQDSGDKLPFRVWSFKVTEPLGTLKEKDGYTLSSGTYTSNYSLYGITPDFDSVTNPLHLKSDYVVDSGFLKEVTIGENDNWSYYWSKGNSADDIQEESGYRYRYYIAEQWIGNSANTVIYDNNEWKSSNGEYIVSYSDNMVETNDTDNPIIINNRNIRYKLPQTGGGGRKSIYILGTLLTAIGIISGSALYRRKRRRI